MSWDYLERSPVATLVLRQGLIAYLNPAAARLTGLRREELEGRPFAPFVEPGELDRVLERQRARLAGEQVPAIYDLAVQVGGQRRTARIHAMAVDGEILLQVLDVTEEASRGLRLVALAELGARVQRERSDEAIYRAVREGMGPLGLACALLVPRGSEAELAFVDTDAGRRTVWEVALGRPLAGVVRPWTPLMRRAWAEGASFTDDFAAETTAYLGVPVPSGLPGTTPLRGVTARIDVGGEPSALLVAMGPWLRRDDLPALRLFGSQVSAALDAARSIQALSARNADLAALDRLATAAGAALDLAAFCETGSRIVTESVRCSGVGVHLLAADGRTIELVHTSRPLADDHPVARTSVDSAFLGRALRTGRPVVAQADELPEPAAGVLRRQGVVTIAAVPFRSHSTANGLLTVSWRERRDAEGCQLPLLEAMGAHFGAAVHSHRLVSDLRTRVSELTLLNDVARASAALDPVDLLDRMVRRVADTFGAPVASAYRVAGQRLEPVVRAGFGEGTLRLTQRLRVGEALVGLAAAERRAVVFPPEAPPGEVVRHLTEQEGLRTMAAIPLLAKERVLGVFALGRRMAIPFTDAEVSLLSALGAQMAVALENAELAAAARRSYDELARTQAQLVRQERLAALGELAAVVAHEVRNPLGAIFNSVGSLRRLLRPAERGLDRAGDFRMLLDIVAEEADRLNRIVGDLLDFARPTDLSIRPERVEPILEEVLTAALPAHPARLEVIREVDPALPALPADARQLRQALLNLVENALQAMPGGGRLALRARRDGDELRLEVADSGPGIPPALRDKVFEPFFTTRASGTGLGMAVVRRVAQAHRGSVALEETPGGGTTVVLRLPIEPQTAVAPGRDLG